MASAGRDECRAGVDNCASEGASPETARISCPVLSSQSPLGVALERMFALVAEHGELNPLVPALTALKASLRDDLEHPEKNLILYGEELLEYVKYFCGDLIELRPELKEATRLLQGLSNLDPEVIPNNWL